MISSQRPAGIWTLIALASALTLFALKKIAPSFAHVPTPDDILQISKLFLPEMQSDLKPESLEHIRYVLGISLYPIFLFSGLLFLKGRDLRLSLPPFFVLMGLLVFFSWNWFKQSQAEFHHAVPTPLSLTLGFAIGALVFAFKDRVKFPNSYFPAASIIAFVYLLIRLSPAVITEGNIGQVPRGVWHHIPFSLSEFAAVLNGRTLWVDFFPQYTNLLPYCLAPLFWCIGMSITHFTTALFLMSVSCFGIVLWLFNRIFGNPWRALLIFIPFVALSLFPLPKDSNENNAEIIHIFNYFSVGPLRYFGPFLNLFVLGRYLIVPSTNRLLILGFVSGASALNNFDFGLPSLVATGAALFLSRTWTPRPVKSFALFALSAFVPLLLFAWLTYLRAGKLPAFSEMFSYQRLFALYGFYMLPMDRYGQHLNIIVTYLACLTIAIQSFVNDRGVPLAETRLMTGMLAFVAVFGCGALMYFVGRSHPNVLVSSFTIWGVACALLLSFFWKHKLDLSWPSRMVVAILFIAGCSPVLVEIPNFVPLTYQVRRLFLKDPFPMAENAKAILSEIAAQGNASLIFLYPYGHHFAGMSGLTNLSPVAQKNSIILWSQWEKLESVARQHRVQWIAGDFSQAMKERMHSMGYKYRFTKSDAEAWSLSGVSGRPK